MLQKHETEEPSPTSATTTATAEAAAIRTAEETLSQDRETELEELTACIEAGITRSKKHRHTAHKTIMKRCLTFFAPIAIILLGCLFAMRQGMLDPMVVTIVSVVLPIIAAMVPQRWRPRAYPGPSEPERLAAQRLAEIDDVRAVGPFIDHLRWSGDPNAPPELWQALGRLLPRLTVEQARDLGKERHSILVLWLQTWGMRLSYSRFAAAGNRPVLGILHVLAQLGQSSIRIVQPFIKTENVSLLEMLGKWAEGQELGQDPAVQQAAAACCEAIRNQTDPAHPSKQLLRASAPTSFSQATLLRPVQSAGHTDPQELLRPGNPETVPVPKDPEVPQG